MTEYATVDVHVKASPELLAEMKDRWSDPVQVMARKVGEEWDFTFRQRNVLTQREYEMVRRLLRYAIGDWFIRHGMIRLGDWIRPR